jgi:putative phage-type endonuclease
MTLSNPEHARRVLAHIEKQRAEAQPYELVCKSTDPEWLQMRQTGIGASEAAALIGANPWKSLLGLYAEKIGAVPQDDLSDNEAVFWGTKLEDVIREVYGQRSGRHIDRGGVLLRSTRYPWALCTLDGWTSDRELGPYWPLELKTTSAVRGEDWIDGAPLHYRVQVAWQMLVTGTVRATIACLIGGQRLVWEDVERDEILERKLIHAGEGFWSRVEKQQPPAPDGSYQAREALHAIYPKDNGVTLVLPAELCDAADELEFCKTQEKAITLRKTTAENALKAALGSTLQGVLPDGRMVAWSTESRKAYQVAASTRRVLRVKQSKQDR